MFQSTDVLTFEVEVLPSNPLWVFTQLVDKRIPSTHFVWWSDTPALRLKQQLKFSLVPCVRTTMLHTCCIAGQQQHSWYPWIQCSTYVVLRRVRYFFLILLDEAPVLQSKEQFSRCHCHCHQLCVRCTRCARRKLKPRSKTRGIVLLHCDQQDH